MSRALSEGRLYARVGMGDEEDEDEDEEEVEDDDEEEDEEDDEEALTNFLAPPPPRSLLRYSTSDVTAAVADATATARAAAAARNNSASARSSASAPRFSGALDLSLYVRWHSSSSSSGRRTTTRLFELELDPLASLDELPTGSREALAGAFPPRAAPAAAAAAAVLTPAPPRHDNGNNPALDADAAAIAAAAAANEAMRQEAQRQRQPQPSSAAVLFANARSSPSSSLTSSTLPAHLTSPDFYLFAPRVEFFAPPGDNVRIEFRLAASPRTREKAGWEFPLATRRMGPSWVRPSGGARETPLLVTAIESEGTRLISYGAFGIRYAFSQMAFPVVSVGRELLDSAARRLT